MRYYLLFLAFLSCQETTEEQQSTDSPVIVQDTQLEEEQCTLQEETVEEFELFSPNLIVCRPGMHEDINHSAQSSSWYNNWSKQWVFCIDEERVEGGYSRYVHNIAGETICGFTYRFSGTFREDLVTGTFLFAFHIEDVWLVWEEAAPYAPCMSPYDEVDPYYRISPENTRDNIPWEIIYSYNASTWYPMHYTSAKWFVYYYDTKARFAVTPDGNLVTRVIFMLTE